VGQWTILFAQRPTRSTEIICFLGVRDLFAARDRLFYLGADSRDAFSPPQHACFRHLGTRYFLDLAGRAAPIVDFDALPEAQFDDVLLAGNRCLCLRGEHQQSEGNQEKEGLRGSATQTIRCEGNIVFGSHLGFPFAAKLWREVY
jgi:hypothetical protein